ncbi:2-succinyl-5-enolpyruvyl-6-hydroxy-3-cyclohexene-1-carboxylic-acid synthase [Actinophytocola gossypii]|uniref:2-succinyl-5-enolpyruvyl-6-hydroxy-3-cyclohexene-1-carboxylate synthase n=1 Tax=Actinophytocola gossypii TaxID=2812003 RepID=A0ABT2JCN8_9PSEU|nr:2-succinyl-5-enolpyruvyl-6-hydroxy-3-cyclohexene-1-carboxylic-acid synthase [Actinophytocola gossypii]MCT2585638.1 2-succinyl-5-enolpyruvyl-6-hydroxy-3-cyclohexene-1-carboxylic-acid synthase [Actinophytocola gossypii]
MNPSTAQASVITDELVRCGVEHVVVCPGSRNAPLSMALFEAARSGRVTLHVRVDERAAAFLALGLATGSARPVALTCTSGTAVANLHPAVLEASHARVPLLLLTADRPPELHGTGANQTVDQRALFGPAAGAVEFPVAERRPGQQAVWRALVCRAVAHAEQGGPVQVNVPFREPLVPTFEPHWPDSLDGRPDGRSWTTVAPAATPVSRVDFPLPARTLMVLGSGSPARARAAAAVAAIAGWPAVAEPPAHAAALSGGANVLRRGTLLLSADLPDTLRPDAVVVVGRPTLSRAIGRVRTQAPTYVIDDAPAWTDPQHLAVQVRTWLDLDDMPHVADVDPDWLPAWRHADTNAHTAVDKLLDEQEWPTGLHLAADVLATIPTGTNLFLGSSNPIRDVDLVAEPRSDVAVFANRGVAGIDGNTSTAAGIALATARPTYALIGDVTFLHDVNALLLGPQEPRPDLTVIVNNDAGGGIFSLLEQGAAEHQESFERVFGTPHQADLAALCAGYGIPHTLAPDREAFRAALRPARGPRVVEVRTTRAPLRDLHARLRTEVTATLH